MDLPRPRRARPEDWSILPLNPLPLASRPLIGWWAWWIPDRIRYTSFHEVHSEGSLLLLGVEPPIGRVGDELVRRLLAVADDPVPPRRGDGIRDRVGHPAARPCISSPPE